MNHEQAKKIIESAEVDVVFDEDMSEVELHGSFTIEELHAVLQLMEYTA